MKIIYKIDSGRTIPNIVVFWNESNPQKKYLFSLSLSLAESVIRKEIEELINEKDFELEKVV